MSLARRCVTDVSDRLDTMSSVSSWSNISDRYCQQSCKYICGVFSSHRPLLLTTRPFGLRLCRTLRREELFFDCDSCGRERSGLTGRKPVLRCVHNRLCGQYPSLRCAATRAAPCSRQIRTWGVVTGSSCEKPPSASYSHVGYPTVSSDRLHDYGRRSAPSTSRLWSPDSDKVV